MSSLVIYGDLKNEGRVCMCKPYSFSGFNHSDSYKKMIGDRHTCVKKPPREIEKSSGPPQ